MKNTKINNFLLLNTLFFGVILAFSFSTFSCSKQNKANGNEKKYSIVASNFVCYDFARAVLGDNLGKTAELKLLIKPGAEVHSFDPTPADIIAINEADLFIYIGGESDEWVDSVLFDAIGKNKNAPACLKLIDFVKTVSEPAGLENAENDEHEHHSHHAHHDIEEENEHDEHDEDAEHEHEHDTESDEHIWTSPKNALIMLEKISNSILETCPTLQQFSILENYQNYAKQIEQIDQRFNEIIENATQKYIVMADRFPFAYFADCYNLNYMAAFAGCSTAVEASSATIAKLIETVKQKNFKHFLS